MYRVQPHRFDWRGLRLLRVEDVLLNMQALIWPLRSVGAFYERLRAHVSVVCLAALKDSVLVLKQQLSSPAQ